MVFRLLGGIDIVLVIGTLLVLASIGIGLGEWEERWHHSISAVLWMSGLSALALTVVRRLG